jgi:mannose-1-phosphate guanylyltransferase
VKTFAEKPDLATASRFVSSGDFYWNSGIFVFKAEVYLKALQKYIPDLYKNLMEIDQAYGTRTYESVLNEQYRLIRSISIDYGIMEQSRAVCMLKGSFKWHDLGSWNEIYRLNSKDKHGNAIHGSARLLDASNCYVYAPDHLVAVVGLDNIVVVQENDVTLICDRSKSEDVKRMVDMLKKAGLKKYV